MQDAGHTAGRKASGSETRRKGLIKNFRVTAAEEQTIKHAAERVGLTVGSYIRSRVLEKPTTRAMRRPPVEVQTLSILQASLNKAGGLLNQIARKLNSGDRLALDEIQAALAQHRQILAAIITTLGRQPR